MKSVSTALKQKTKCVHPVVNNSTYLLVYKFPFYDIPRKLICITLNNLKKKKTNCIIHPVLSPNPATEFPMTEAKTSN